MLVEGNAGHSSPWKPEDKTILVVSVACILLKIIFCFPKDNGVGSEVLTNL